MLVLLSFRDFCICREVGTKLLLCYYYHIQYKTPNSGPKRACVRVLLLLALVFLLLAVVSVYVTSWRPDGVCVCTYAGFKSRCFVMFASDRKDSGYFFLLSAASLCEGAVLTHAMLGTLVFKRSRTSKAAFCLRVSCSFWCLKR